MQVNTINVSNSDKLFGKRLKIKLNRTETVAALNDVVPIVRKSQLDLNKNPCWNFKKIRKNVYGKSMKPIRSRQILECYCYPEYGCGDNCLNRLLFTECNLKMCPCSRNCQNMKIQKHAFAMVEKFMTESKGWGVKTKETIRGGNFVLEYLGEVVSQEEFKERMTTLYVNDNHHYGLHLEGDRFLDAHRMGNDCRFVNHSCDPNCEMQKWAVNGLPRMALFAVRDIPLGEEITFDYNFTLFESSGKPQNCKCGSQKCRGTIGAKSQQIR